MTTNELNAVLEAVLRNHAEKSFGISDAAAIIAAVIALGALVVAYLARTDSRRSANEARHANELMARQLELAIEAQNREVKKEITESLPVILWRGGSSVQKQMNWDFENLGGDISDITIETVEGVSASISPSRFIQHNKPGSATFICNRENFPFPFTFKIIGDTKLGKRVSQQFKFDAPRQPILVQTE